jgi:hypothetical protein
VFSEAKSEVEDRRQKLHEGFILAQASDENRLQKNPKEA